jgi:hypothetical protein
MTELAVAIGLEVRYMGYCGLFTSSVSSPLPRTNWYIRNVGPFVVEWPTGIYARWRCW